MYCYLEFKFRYLENLKLFSIRVKELFEPKVLRKTKTKTKTNKKQKQKQKNKTKQHKTKQQKTKQNKRKTKTKTKQKTKNKNKKKNRIFAVFKSISWETDLWVALGDFTVKKRKEKKKKPAKLGREICMLPKIDQVETKYGVWKIITVICVTYMQKNF